MNIVSRIYRKRWMLRSLLKTIYFNFHYLPFNQAIKLPIILYKVSLLKASGNVKICKMGGVKFGMVILGKFTSPLFPNNGMQFYNEGTIVFDGDCKIGNGSSIVVTKNAILKFGDYFQATASFKVNCSYKMKFGEKVLVGYNSSFIDTDYHHLTMVDGSEYPKPYGEVVIGDGCWFGFNSIVMKNTVIPAKCVVASNSLLNKNYKCPPCSLLAGTPAMVKKENVFFLDHKNHVIKYE